MKNESSWFSTVSGSSAAVTTPVSTAVGMFQTIPKMLFTTIVAGVKTNQFDTNPVSYAGMTQGIIKEIFELEEHVKGNTESTYPTGHDLPSANPGKHKIGSSVGKSDRWRGSSLGGRLLVPRRPGVWRQITQWVEILDSKSAKQARPLAFHLRKLGGWGEVYVKPVIQECLRPGFHNLSVTKLKPWTLQT